MIEKSFYSYLCNMLRVVGKAQREYKSLSSLLTARVGCSGSRMRAQIEHGALSPEDFREVVSVMKVRRGKQLENCCNLAGNVI